MAEKDYSSTIMRMAGNIAAGLVGTPHFQHQNGVMNHRELVAVSVDLARQIVATVIATGNQADSAERAVELGAQRHKCILTLGC